MSWDWDSVAAPDPDPQLEPIKLVAVSPRASVIRAT